MPSEIVHGNPFDVRIAWGVDHEEVQVASVVGDGAQGADRLVGIVNEWLASAGLPTIDLAVLRAKAEAPIYFDGWHASLAERRHVNQLINRLRRARDSAFGRDE